MIPTRSASTSASSRYCVVRKTVTPSSRREARHLDPERVAALRVEPGRRLVEEEDRRPVQECEREVEAALHPARVRRAPCGPQLRSDRRARAARRRGSRARRARGRAATPAGGCGRGPSGTGRAQPPGAPRRSVSRTFGPSLTTSNPPTIARPPVGRHQRGQHVDGRRLPGAVRAEKAVDLPVGDLEIDPVDGSNGLELADEPLGDDRAHRETVATAGPPAWIEAYLRCQWSGAC